MNSSTLSNRDWSDSSHIQSFIQELQSSRHARFRHKVFYIEGVRNFIQAVNHGYGLQVIYYSEKLLVVPSARQRLRKLRRSGIPCINVSPEKFRQTSTTKRASGISAIVKMKPYSLHKTPVHSGLSWIVLDNVRAEGNFGTLIRSSEAVGGAGFILLNKSVDPYSPATIRASMGSLFNQRFIYTSATQLQNWIRRHKTSLIGASIDGQYEFQNYRYPPTPLLFLGEERKGLTEEQQNMCDHLVKIPMTGNTDSLNLGVAGSLLLYEVFRKNRYG